MAGFRIFTESNADIVFIRQYVQTSFNLSLSEKDDFFPLKSWSGYKAGGDVFPDIRLAHDQEKSIILILDADNDFAQRQAEVIDDFQRYNIPVSLFLFPNGQSIGNREDLLTSIAVDRKLISCFQSYEQCVKEYNLPLAKSRIYSYLDTILPADYKTPKNDLRKDEFRDYTNPAHWNLNHDCLSPFHNFLKPFLQK